MPDEPAAEATPPRSSRRTDAGRTPRGRASAGRARRRRLRTKRRADVESVREKIETRYGTAIGAAELNAESPEGRTVEEQYDARQRAAAERLAEIRKSMHPEQDDAQ